MPSKATPEQVDATVDELRTATAVRERCGSILESGIDGNLEGFRVDLDRLGAVVELVAGITVETYPNLEVPFHSRWRHFEADGVHRLRDVTDRLGSVTDSERARALFDLVTVSVLLDAGAGADWRYDDGTGHVVGRSEGLAIASLRAFCAGLFSSDPKQPLQVDAKGLEALTQERLGRAFQVRPDNPLVGLRGRVGLMHGLAAALRERRRWFGAAGRPGGLADALQQQGGPIAAPAILKAVLDGFAPIWPGRLSLGPHNLGDVWRHPAAGGHGLSAGLVPFHKLSQWLTYSLVEPLQWAGRVVTDFDALTGLAEYRNGGLFIDLGVLVPRDPRAHTREHRPDAPLIVEWRALTVALLDRVAPLVREALQRTTDQLPLCCILQGGTWTAGRRVARQARTDGSPPLRIDSDGTVF